MREGKTKVPVLILGERHTTILLVAMLEANRRVKLSELYQYLKFKSLNPLTDRMAQEGLITKKIDRETYVITFLELTPKGRAIAEKLKEAFDILQED